MTKKNRDDINTVDARLDWDRSLRLGDLVCLSTDGDTPHVYEVVEIRERMLMEHHFYLHESLASTGKKPGDDVAPLVTIKRVRTAPSYRLLGPRQTYRRTVSAEQLIKVTQDQISQVCSNLKEMSDYIERTSK